METSIKGLNKWANAHTNFGLDVLRVALGVFFIYKATEFITNSRGYEDLIAPVSNFLGGMFTFHYIAFAHIVGGVLLIFGLLSRWSIIAQLPILMGAILLNIFDEFNLFNFVLATAVFGISVFFVFYGSGKHSADYYFKMEK